ncbi:uncharacterized protein LOC127780385 isoform X1 [Oryza glaberrima]|uniref:uncharacterized protein LOC127780385 isoform X1 n=1 Tax=Oryza glaberrima TaxID=4538 RepID=UPI00224C31FB|nr:uncharacterized protein LOC127780385 isoform X1 [Oryza glaberrima]
MNHPSSAATATVLLLLALLDVAAGGGEDGQKRAAGVYIVIVQPPADGADTVAYHTCILAAALGSEGRAKEALLYSYRAVASGFAAKLTPPELAALQSELISFCCFPYNPSCIPVPPNYDELISKLYVGCSRIFSISR